MQKLLVAPEETMKLDTENPCLYLVESGMVSENGNDYGPGQFVGNLSIMPNFCHAKSMTCSSKEVAHM